MFAQQPHRMTDEEFFAWEEKTRPERHELLDGIAVPRRLRAMSGGTVGHSLFSTNIAAAVRQKLPPGPSRAHGSNLKIRTPAGSIRYPDAAVDCGALDLKSYIASEPTVVFEVLSPSNRPGQLLVLLADYQSIPSLAHIVFLEQTEPAGVIYSRGESGWVSNTFRGWDTMLELTAIQVRLPLIEVYEDLLAISPELSDRSE